MQLTDCSLADALLIEPQLRKDHRGFFAQTFCEKTFAARGLETTFAQCCISFNAQRGTLRGLHFQHPPFPQAKLVRCTQGSIYDVILDLRPDSPTFGQWQGFLLSASNRHTLYVPKGFAHGFQTLEDASEVFYQIAGEYAPQAEGGIVWNDTQLSIDWPVEQPILSERDAALPTFSVASSQRLAEALP